MWRINTLIFTSWVPDTIYLMIWAYLSPMSQMSLMNSYYWSKLHSTFLYPHIVICSFISIHIFSPWVANHDLHFRIHTCMCGYGNVDRWFGFKFRPPFFFLSRFRTIVFKWAPIWIQGLRHLLRTVERNRAQAGNNVTLPLDFPSPFYTSFGNIADAQHS